MKTKWNWGTKLVIWIVVFVLFILTLVYLSFGYDVNLVEKDYYPKGLVYQSRINAIENAKDLGVMFEIKQNNDNINISIPDIESDSGIITFFRPSDVNFDRAYKLETNRKVEIPTDHFTRGKYIVRFNWWHGDKEFYFEQMLNVK